MTEFSFLKHRSDHKLLMLIGGTKKYGPVGILVERYGENIYRFLLRLTADPAWAEKQTVKTFVKIFSEASSFDPADKPRDWIYWMACNMALEGLKSRPSAKTIGPDNTPGGRRSALERSGLAARLDEAETEMAFRLYEAMSELKDHYRIAVVLHQFEGFDHEAVACIMEADVASVKSWINRARKRMAQDIIFQEAQE